MAKERGVRVAVHAHVHLELCRHLRTKLRATYSPSVIRTYLEQQAVDIEAMTLDLVTAERWAERLAERYETLDSWENAKLSTLGGALRRDFVNEPGRMPMTTDWWVALMVEDNPEDRVAVDDQGGEWQTLRASGRALTADQTKEWLSTLHP